MSDAPVKKVVVQPEDDWQIWVVRGKLADGFEFVLPIKARPYKNGDARYFQVNESGTYNAREWDELTRILDAHDFCPQEKCWWFAEERFRTVASEVRGANPDYYTRWPLYQPPKPDDGTETIEEAEDGFSGEEIKFIKRVHYALGDM